MSKVHASLVIDAPVEHVWDKIKNFHDLSWAPGLIASCVAIGDEKGNVPGAKRLINGQYLDRLIEYDAATHAYIYAVQDAPAPISPTETHNFISHLRLSEASQNQTLAEYSGGWDEESDDAVDLVNEIYTGLLEELSQRFSP